jgi:hypothetical protein
MRKLCQFFFILIIAGIISSTFPKITSAQSFKVELLVAVCNANLICEDVIGENYGSCPSDCEAPPPPPIPPTVPNITGAPQGSGGYTNTSVFTNIPAVQNPNTGSGSSSNNGFPTGIQTKPDAVLPKLGVDGIISISPDTNQVAINFKTYLPSLLNISWGKTATYEIGSSAEVSYRSNFAAQIQGLEAGTVYYYRLVLLDSIGRTIEYEGKFTTSNRFVKAPLPSPTDFRARQGLQGTGIELMWNIETVLKTLQQEYERSINDSDPTNDIPKPNLYVRLVRSEFGFPVEPLEGKVIYEGRGERASDFDVTDGDDYFYSLFVLNQKGQYSSPNVIRLQYKSTFSSTDAEKSEGEGVNRPDGVFYDPLIKNKDAVPLKDLLEAEERMGYCGISSTLQPVLTDFSASDSIQKDEKNILVRFLQDKQELEIKGGVVIGHDRSALIVHVEGGQIKRAKNLSLCLVSNQTGRQNHYLLSQNQDGSYELILPGFFHKSGAKNDYQFALGMIEYKGEEIVLLRGEIQFTSIQKTSLQLAIRIGFLTLVLVLILRSRLINKFLHIRQT